ncbi:MAG: hypothetical protein JSU59_06235 [Nitrospirota bacterium]|nr:MAG: hypothetical protein JSU59_06235 [Nitrospirota bacterium]
MHFDPAIAAQQALHRAEEGGELGTCQREVVEAEEVFSTEAGSVAKQAYERLQQLGETLPHALRFQEFLIYITWQQVTEETIPEHFQKGLQLCDRFLVQFGKEIKGTDTDQRITDIRKSFQGGLGIDEEENIPEHDEDSFKGGD